MARIGKTWNNMYAVFNDNGLMITIPTTEDKAEKALERIKSADIKHLQNHLTNVQDLYFATKKAVEKK